MLLTTITRINDMNALESITNKTILVQINKKTTPLMTHTLTHDKMNLIFLNQFEPNNTLLNQLHKLTKTIPLPTIQTH